LERVRGAWQKQKVREMGQAVVGLKKGMKQVGGWFGGSPKGGKVRSRKRGIKERA